MLVKTYLCEIIDCEKSNAVIGSAAISVEFYKSAKSAFDKVAIDMENKYKNRNLRMINFRRVK